MSHHHRHHGHHGARAERIPVEIPVIVTSVLTAADEATLSNLTEQGAMITGASLPAGTHIHIEYEGQTLFGIVVWCEHDRFGARFPFHLCEGPLHDRLEQARMEHEMRCKGFDASPVAHSGGTPAPRPFAGFGRRGLN